MVKYQDADLDRVFAALSDQTRRGMLARLSGKPGLSVSELAKPLDMSLPAAIKHLDVLADAGLVTRNKTGRTVACQMEAAPMQQAMEWLEKYRKFWSGRLDRLTALLENEPWQPGPASPSSAASRRRRKKSSPRGRSRTS